jgi:hypothetical protein
MKKFSVEFERTEAHIYSAVVEADSAEEALDKFKANPRGYKWETIDFVDVDEVRDAMVIGEYDDDKRIMVFTEPVTG